VAFFAILIFLPAALTFEAKENQMMISSALFAVALCAGSLDVHTVPVSGSGTDFLTGAIVHSERATPAGKIVRSTESVELEGDLKGRILYHVTSEFDFVQMTLVNTGHQVYSGTVAGSEPVLLFDDEFRFDVNLASGEEQGKVFLVTSLAGPKVRCTLDVTGTGMNADGNPTFTYAGACVFRGN
jgi:hypothetical protein